DQAWWMQRLLADGAAADMPFVVWWSDHDLMPEHAAVPCHCTVPDDPFCQVLATAPPADAKLLRSFSTMGVRDFDGAPRPSLVPWQAAAAARRLPDPPDGTPSLTSGAFPGFRFQVIIDPGDRPIPGQSEVPCLAETLS
ncbi:MAG TPA: hypothetical protein VMT16_03225, partial [Thermoanaerobaculia bacterium]|nr:hypothetical protein [Thermoanaerobaculia bacterium]